MKTLMTFAMLVALTLSACASQTQSGYISPSRFQTFDCNRMGNEMVKVDPHYQQASEEYREYSQSFGLRLAASLVTFPLHQRFPSDGTDRLQRLRQLKAEADVLRGIAMERGCSVSSQAQ